MKLEAAVFGTIAVLVVSLSFINIPQKEASLPNLGKAPELAGIKAWLNSEPLSVEKLKGKVILVDFWTYSCINCIRTLPYLNAWHEKYAGKGLIIIGVHTPEFEFEKDYNNVKSAVEKYGIKYPVAQDNDYATWRAYKNNYWPRKYIVDTRGDIRYDHIGEGGYEETEKVIIALLKESSADVKENMTEIKQDVDFSNIGTPELYLGYKFARAPLGNGEGFSPGSIVDYKDTEITNGNIVYLSGQWKNEEDRIVAVRDSRLFLVYKAKDVNIVAGGNATIRVLLDGKPLATNYFGKDVIIKESTAVAIDSHRLFNIVSTPAYGTHLLELVASPGFEMYAFTFG